MTFDRDFQLWHTKATANITFILASFMTFHTKDSNVPSLPLSNKTLAYNVPFREFNKDSGSNHVKENAIALQSYTNRVRDQSRHSYAMIRIYFLILVIIPMVSNEGKTHIL